MSDLVWQIVNDIESCNAQHILYEERKHKDGVWDIFACLDCLEEGIRKVERERIIKLLEANLIYADWEGIFRKYPDGEIGCAVDVSDIIALIKRETE